MCTQTSTNVRLLITIVLKLAVIQLDHTPVLVELVIKIMDMETVLVRTMSEYRTGSKF